VLRAPGNTRRDMLNVGGGASSAIPIMTALRRNRASVSVAYVVAILAVGGVRRPTIQCRCLIRKLFYALAKWRCGAA
jgi:hypothetical protein